MKKRERVWGMANPNCGARVSTDNAGEDAGESALILPGEQENGSSITDEEDQEMAEEMTSQQPGE